MQPILYSTTVQNLVHAVAKTVQTLAPSALVWVVDMAVLSEAEELIHSVSESLNLPSSSISITCREELKTLDTCQLIWQQHTLHNTDRKALQITIGGGMLTDLAGFAAATQKRGIRFLNIPTTLLAMVDASVGGKTGIDFMGFKNQIGVFSPAQAVFVCTEFLNTLPERQVLAGMAEMLKHAVLDGPAHFDSFQQLLNAHTQGTLKAQDWLAAIQHSVAVKEAIVAQDPKEQAERKLLNLGHTFGHAFESLALAHNISLLHGEAVALGICLEVAYSELVYRHRLPNDIEACAQQLLKGFMERGELTAVLGQAPVQVLWPFMLQDKKNSHNAVETIGIKAVGQCVYGLPVQQEQLVSVLTPTWLQEVLAL